MIKIFNQYGIFPTKEQIEQLEEYYGLLVEWNKKINLTTIIEKEDVFWKHFLDSSLAMLSDLWIQKKSAKVLDVGTGAGFPGMVLAIFNPEKQFVLLDSLKKRVDFLLLVMDQLQLSNVKVFHGRAENYGRRTDFRNQFDFVVSRAVAELPVLMEYCIPFVCVDGYFISYKGKRQEEELRQSVHAFTELSAEFDHMEEYLLRENEKRVLLYIRNCCETNEKYPRREGKPKKKPL